MDIVNHESFKGWVKLIGDACGIASISMTVITIIKGYIVFSLPWFLPIPIIAIVAYLIVAKLPDAISKIKNEIALRNMDNLTEQQEKDLEELKNIIDDKLSVILTSRTHNTTQSEPTSNSLPISSRR